jgi:hypothetical protein
MSLKLSANADAIAAQFQEFAKEVEADINKAMENLATLTRAQIALEAQRGDDKLNSTLHIYMENLSDVETQAPGVFVITLDEKALWIEEGLTAHDMKQDLLQGKPYRVIPFKYNTKPSQTEPSTQLIVSAIQRELKARKIPYSAIENNPDGSPKLGKLHDLKWGVNLRDPRNKSGTMGGNIGMKIPGKGNTPRLQGLSIYQKIDKNTGNVRRDILTFRTVSAGPASEGKWLHPGLAAKKYMDKAMEEAIRQWEEKILPGILDKWNGK